MKHLKFIFNYNRLLLAFLKFLCFEEVLLSRVPSFYRRIRGRIIGAVALVWVSYIVYILRLEELLLLYIARKHSNPHDSPFNINVNQSVFKSNVSAGIRI